MENIAKMNKPYKYLGPSHFYKKLILIALPVMGQQLIQNFVSLIDNFMVAGLGDIKMSGVNIASQFVQIFMVLINAFCISGGIFMSQYLGSKNKEGMRQVFRYKVIVTLITGIIISIVYSLNLRSILSLMVHGNTQSEAIIVEGIAYMKLIAWTFIPIALSNAMASSLREIGKVKEPLLISVAATLVNTFFNYIFIYGNFGAPRLEVRGAAIATIIARVFEMLFYAIFIMKTKPDFYTRLRDILKVKLTLVGTILKKSAMIIVPEMTWIISETITTALYNSRGGAEIVSGMAAGFAISNLFFIAFGGLHTSIGVVLGSTLGANKLDEARQQKNWLLNGSIIFGIVMGLLGAVTVFLIPLVYSNLSPRAHEVTRNLILVTSFYMPCWLYINAQFAISRTGGDTLLGFIVDMTTITTLVIPGMFALTYLTSMGPVTMYAIIKLTDFVKITIAHFWLKKERWVRNLTTSTQLE